MPSKFECTYCGSKRFKSLGGLKQHQAKAATCRDAYHADMNLGICMETQENTMVVDNPSVQDQPLPRRSARVSASRDACATANEHEADASRSPAVDRNDDPDDETSENSMGQVKNSDPPHQESDDSDEESEVYDDDDDRDIDDFQHNGLQDFLPPLESDSDSCSSSDSDGTHEEYNEWDDDEDSVAEVCPRFHKFCEGSRYNEALSGPERTGIKLMKKLRDNKAPLKAYDDLFQWHLEEKGAIFEGDTPATAGERHYISRERLMKNLMGRYGIDKMKPHERTVRLPFSNEVITIPCHHFHHCLEALLTDPRITDDHYTFFNDDPMAGPSESDTIGDLNTGQAYKDTYEVLINAGDGEQLLGIIFYIDGAATGLFADLPVTIVKFSLSIFTNEARKKDYCWANLGYIPQVQVSDSAGKRTVEESGHMEAEDLDRMEGEGDLHEEDEDSDGRMRIFLESRHRIFMRYWR